LSKLAKKFFEKKIRPIGLKLKNFFLPVSTSTSFVISRFSDVDRDQHYQSKWANFHFYLTRLLPPIS